jgi:hypothetical protein
MLHQARQINYFVKPWLVNMSSPLRAALLTFENVIPSSQRTTTQRGFNKSKRALSDTFSIKDPQGEVSRTFLSQSHQGEALITADQ